VDKRHRGCNCQATLPSELEPARQFYDFLAQLVADAVLRDIREPQHSKRRQRPIVKRHAPIGPVK
jgi:hypothetical protein